MLYTDKVEEEKWELGNQYARNYVAYSLGHYFPSPEFPQREGGTGNTQWDDLLPKQKELSTSINVPIANASHDYSQKLLKAQKLDSIIQLSKVLDDENLHKALTALGITLDTITI